MRVSKQFTPEEAYLACVQDYTEAVRSALCAVSSRTIAAGSFDEFVMDLLSARYGEHIQRGELLEHVPFTAVRLAEHVEGLEL